MKIFHIPAFTDNYIWCIQKNNKLAVVDPGDSKELLNLIKDNDLILEDILITHHHFDHTGGLEDLHKLVKGNIYGPKQSNKFINKFVSENDEIEVLGNKYKIFETPGHTLDHISYYSEDINSVFVGILFFRVDVVELLKAHLNNCIIQYKNSMACRKVHLFMLHTNILYQFTVCIFCSR